MKDKYIMLKIIFWTRNFKYLRDDANSDKQYRVLNMINR